MAETPIICAGFQLLHVQSQFFFILLLSKNKKVKTSSMFIFVKKIAFISHVHEILHTTKYKSPQSRGRSTL